MTTRRALVIATWLVAVAGALALVIAAGAAPTLAESGISPVFSGLAMAIVTDVSVGAALTLRRPGNVVGLLLLAAAILLAITFVGFASGAILTEQRGRTDLAAGLVSLIGPLGIYPTLIVAGPLVAIVFPDGRLPGPRWRWSLGAIAGAVAISSAIAAVRPGPPGASFADNPLGLAGFSGIEPLWAIGETIGAATMPFALALAVAAVVVRVRRSEGIERAQLKWFVAANVAFAASLTVSMVDGSSWSIFDVLAPWSLSLPPIAIGVAILRYRLFEIDRIISRTLSWALVTGLLGAVFVGLVVGPQALSADITGTNTLAVAASTLVVAAAFQPLRRRIQNAVDRRFNRARYDAQRTTDGFSEHLRNEVDLARLRAALVETVDEAVRPTSATVWLRAGAEAGR